jgi:hypothetical protein
VRLDDGPSTWEVSDHCPVVADFDLQPMTGPKPWDDRFVDDTEATLRPILVEEREWGVWTPGEERPRFSVGRTRGWISMTRAGYLVDGRGATLDLGLWRDPKKTSHESVAYAGFFSKGSNDPIEGLQVRLVGDTPPGCTVVNVDYADYVVVPFEGSSDLPPEPEIRAALDTLIGAARLT